MFSDHEMSVVISRHPGDVSRCRTHLGRRTLLSLTRLGSTMRVASHSGFFVICLLMCQSFSLWQFHSWSKVTPPAQWQRQHQRENLQRAALRDAAFFDRRQKLH